MCTTCNTMQQTTQAADNGGPTEAGIDQARSEAFADRMMQRMNDAATAIMTSIGHRTGLFDAMADGSPMTSQDLAERAGLSERYVREWLGAMTCARIVEHDRATKTYRLPAEHACWLTRAAAPNNLAGMMQWVGMLGTVEGTVVDAFTHGRGVPYEAYQRFSGLMAEESDQTVVAALDEHILPLVPGLTDRLEAGIDVLDVGCGEGHAIMHMAQRFPKSRFTGYDLLPESIDAAKAEAKRRGLTNIRFEQRDVAAMDDEGRFDLVTTFDAVHDQARPAEVLAHIRRALKPDGVYLCQEIRAETEHADNLEHPLGPFVYTISCMHCMSVSLANGGPGLGAAWGRQLCQQMLGEAGFTQIDRKELAHDIQNDWYIARAA